MQRNSDEINRMDILRILLFAEGSEGIINEPIDGKTRLQKELFLSHQMLKTQEPSNDISRPYSFRPYRYGPYCKEIYNDIEWLKRKDIVEEDIVSTAYGGIVRRFRLTSKGVQETRQMIQERGLESQYNIIKEVKRRFNAMSVVELVEFTHREFADYVGQDHRY